MGLISEQTKYKSIVVKHWTNYFGIRKYNCEQLLKKFEILKAAGFNIYPLNQYLIHLEMLECEYQKTKDTADAYSNIIKKLQKGKQLLGIQYCIDVLERHKKTYSFRLKDFKQNHSKKPSRTSAKFIRSSIIHYLIIGNELLTSQKAFKNKSEIYGWLAETLDLLEPTIRKAPSQESIRQDYHIWRRKKQSVNINNKTNGKLIIKQISVKESVPHPLV